MKRGEIWDIEFPLLARENAEPYGHGPVVIVSSDDFNASRIQTVLVAVMTSNTRLAAAPGNVLLLANEVNGLRHDSVINVSQVLVVDKARLRERRGELDETSLELLNLEQLSELRHQEKRLLMPPFSQLLGKIHSFHSVTKSLKYAASL